MSKVKDIILILPAIVIFLFIANELNFIQDDAYISFRHIENFLNGNGLVYNVGERVEGFTNFGWVIFLAFWGSLGIDYILMSKIFGIVFGIGIILVTYLIAVRVFEEESRLFAVLPAYLLGVNPSLAYWSPAGLETSIFGFFTLLSVYFFITRKPMLIVSMAIVVLIRPEGALVAGMIVIAGILLGRRPVKFTIVSVLAAFLISLPFVFFKLYYYGSILPNPFYAKTAFTMDQLKTGLEYSKSFFVDYGFYGAGIVLPVLFFRRINYRIRVLLLFFIVYAAYVTYVGGDFLKVHRFYLPVIGLYAVLISYSIYIVFSKLQKKYRLVLPAMVSVPLVLLTYVLPIDEIKNINMYEKVFTSRMAALARSIEDSDSSGFSVALPTIGIFGYELVGHDIIDMVGLTDSTIARHPESHTEGISVAWKEQKHNSRYLLKRAPDYIIFSTGLKPSAPAEKELLIFKQFIESYRAFGWWVSDSVYSPDASLMIGFKKVRPVSGEIEPYYPPDYVEYYRNGLDASAYRKHDVALKWFKKALDVSPEPYNPRLLYNIAFSLKMNGNEWSARYYLSEMLKQDSVSFLAHRALHMYATGDNDRKRVELHERWLNEIAPWYFKENVSSTGE